MKTLLFLFLICLGSCSSRSKLIKKQPIADNFVQQPQKANKESATQHKLLKDSSKMVFIVKPKNFKTKNSNISNTESDVVTKKINGGQNGKDDRKAKLTLAKTNIDCDKLIK